MQHEVIPLALFACITYVFKAIIDARMRYLLLRAGGSEDLIRSILLGEERQRRHASLRWGVVLVSLGVAFGLIEAFHWTDITPGAIGLLAAATGLGNLAYFAVARRLA